MSQTEYHSDEPLTARRILDAGRQLGLVRRDLDRTAGMRCPFQIICKACSAANRDSVTILEMAQYTADVDGQSVLRVTPQLSCQDCGTIWLLGQDDESGWQSIPR